MEMEKTEVEIFNGRLFLQWERSRTKPPKRKWKISRSFIAKGTLTDQQNAMFFSLCTKELLSDADQWCWRSTLLGNDHWCWQCTICSHVGSNMVEKDVKLWSTDKTPKYLKWKISRSFMARGIKTYHYMVECEKPTTTTYLKDKEVRGFVKYC